MIGAAATRSTELLPLRVRLRGVTTIDEEQNEQIINKAGRSTYPDRKSVLRTEATRVRDGQLPWKRRRGYSLATPPNCTAI
jgi:hypothetical protein